MRERDEREKERRFDASAVRPALRGQTGETLARSLLSVIRLSDLKMGAAPFSPGCSLANRCAILKLNTTISAPLALRGRPRGRNRELAAAPSRGFLVQFKSAGGEKKRKTPFVPLALFPHSVSTSLHHHHDSPGAALAAQAIAASRATKRRDRAILRQERAACYKGGDRLSIGGSQQSGEKETK